MSYGINFKGKKSNAESLNVDSNGKITDSIVYRFIATYHGYQDANIAMIKASILAHSDCPKIGDPHPTIVGILCDGLSFSQTSNDASNEFVIDVTASYGGENNVLSEEDRTNLISFDMSTNYKSVPFEYAYLKIIPVDNDNTEKQTIEKNNKFYMSNPPKKVFKDSTWNEKRESEQPNDMYRMVPKELYQVENSVGTKIPAKTSLSYNTITFSYYCDVFNSDMYYEFINTVNLPDHHIEDVLIESYTGRITNIKYRPVTFYPNEEEKKDIFDFWGTNDTNKKQSVMKVDVTIEINPNGWGQVLPNEDKVFAEKPTYIDDDLVNNSHYRVKTIFTDDVGLFGPEVMINGKTKTDDGEETYIPSAFGSEASLLDKIKNTKDLTNEDKLGFAKLVKPVSNNVTLDQDGQIRTIITGTEHDMPTEKMFPMYYYYLDYKPMSWDSMGWENLKTKEYVEYLKSHKKK